jgi:hypothetical protein
VRSEREKWQVPESDPAGQASPETGYGSLDLPAPGATPADVPTDASTPVRSAERAPLIYCGQCGGLNPATNHYCAACGATLVDAFHASEGLRVYDRPDTASRLIEILPAGTQIDVVDDPDSGPDFLRVKLEYGRMGYIRLADVAALADALPDDPAASRPDINTNARGCVTQTSALAALALFLSLGVLALVFASQTDASESGIVALAACITLGPLIAVTIGLYVYARSRDERLAEEAEGDATT